MIHHVLTLALFALAFLFSAASSAETRNPALRPSVMDFGALGDGRSVDTMALQKTIDEVASKGGGIVVVPEGVFTSGALFLKPGVNLHLEKNAVLRGSTRIEDYPKTQTRIEGHLADWRPALINASACHGLRIDVAISGISFKDSGFWNLHLYRCRNVLVENVSISSPIGAPGTDGIDIDSCQDVTVRGCR